MSFSSLFRRPTGGSEPSEPESPEIDRRPPEPIQMPTPRVEDPGTVWSASPALERLYREFTEQMHALEEAKGLIEERLTPFQHHLTGQRANVEQAQRQLDSRLRPLKQYIETQEATLEKVGNQLDTELKGQFEAFDQFLSEERGILVRAQRYLAEQRRPLGQYLDDQQHAIDNVFRDVQEKLEPFGRCLREQQKLLAAIGDREAVREFDSLSSYCVERQSALERHATASEYPPHTLFAELEAIHAKYDRQEAKSRLFSLVLEETRQADVRLRDSFKGPMAGPDPRLLDRPEPSRAEGRAEQSWPRTA